MTRPAAPPPLPRPEADGGRTARTYLDWNATAPLRPEARAAMQAAMQVAGNPSSVHAEGRAARALVEEAREQVAALVDCAPGEVIFCSGATEAARVLGLFGGRVEVAPTAHECLRAWHGGAGAPVVRALGLADGETGMISELPGAAGDGDDGLLLLDVVQAVGRIPFSFARCGAAMAILSAHKLGGPKGVGALILRDGVEIPALTPGGGQELGRRSGTENTIGIAGFGAAAAAARADRDRGVWSEVEKIRNLLERTIATSAPDVLFIMCKSPRLPNTSAFAVPGWTGEIQVIEMDLAGFAISAGAACSSGKVRQGRVLKALGYDDVTARSAIRVSIGPETTQQDVLRFASAWLTRYRTFRARAA